MPILASFMVPHPPMIVPAVGRGSEKQVLATTQAYQQVAREIASLQPDTIVITSPHATLYNDYFHISPGKKARGSFSYFRAPDVRFTETYDEDLVEKISELAYQDGFAAGTLGEREPDLDHGTMVPLYFIEQEYKDFRLVRIGLSGLPLTDHYRLGMYIASAAKELSRNVVLVASGDLSHKLQEYGPYGFAKEGPQYDARIMDVMGRGAFGELLDFDADFCDKAAECGHRSFVIMAGAWDGRKVKAAPLSHQDVTGVGYGICTFYPKAATSRESDDLSSDAAVDPDRQFLKIHLAAKEQALADKAARSDAYVRLARMTIEQYVKNGKKPSVAELPDLPSELLSRRAGAFVSIHEHGQLRGCIGTIGPTARNLAQEIVNNAVSASTRDPRFDPIREDELPWLEINVDVLGEPEEIDSEEQLDVKRYGVIVSTRDGRRGLLLPDIEGVDDVKSQVRIAMHKGGIQPHEKYYLQRFEVVRHT